MPTPPRKLVIFDIDGTLVDSQVSILASMEFAFRNNGRPVPAREDALGIVGLSLPEAMTVLAPDATPSERDRLVHDYKYGHATHREGGAQVANAPLYDGALRAIEGFVERGYALSAATGKSRAGLDRFLAAHGIDHHFAGTQTADDAPSKPHPQMILNCLAATGADPSDAVIIGDTEFDVRMGAAAGTSTIGVNWGYHGEDRLRRAGADRLASHFDELADLVGELLGRP